MKIADLPKPITHWKEDEEGNALELNLAFDPNKTFYTHYKFMEVREPVYRTAKYSWWKKFKAKLKREYLPSTVCIFEGHTNGTPDWELIKYFVEQRGFTLNDAVILYFDLCEDCLNEAIAEVHGEIYKRKGRTCCDYCRGREK